MQTPRARGSVTDSCGPEWAKRQLLLTCDMRRWCDYRRTDSRSDRQPDGRRTRRSRLAQADNQTACVATCACVSQPQFRPSPTPLPRTVGLLTAALYACPHAPHADT
ncbi:unnamed protein product [Protopolystoma xenopodis]|uniref:Uncharacterized protein n=1 Tax=Protopolystoma xenopodis TaxID=117903 RepID=A0A448XQ38_9PLAT|nr:unnamed protein product [Protopolystoma xenopodis]